MKPRATVHAGIAATAAIAALSLEALAQSATPEVRLEKVEVTGTNIRRTDAETALPVQVITREDIDRGGMVTAQDILDRVSANQSYGGWNDNLGVGSSLAGYTGASLRGLGAERTLVLLNGRRLAPYALSGGQSVDLSGIPVSAIERVEVLKDGASAVYGTDAIGGVINFILRKDYRGVEASATYLGVQQGGGENLRVSLTGGWGDLAKDRFNAFLTVDHVRQEPLPAKDREFSRTSYIPEAGLDGTSSSSFPANIRQRGGFGNQARNPTIPVAGATGSSCAPPLSFPTATFPRACMFDYVPLVDNIAESRKTNVVGRLAWQAHADHLLFAEGSYYRGDFTYKISPTPAIPLDFFGNPFQLLPGSPFYPTAFVASLPRGNTNLPVQVAYRLAELGPRMNVPETEQARLVAGAQGAVRGWDYQFSAGHTANRQVDGYSSGIVSEARFRELFDSGVVNPFAPNTLAVVEQLRSTQIIGPVSDNRASHTGAELKFSSTPWEVAAGGVAVAFGLEGRREQLEQVNSDVLYSGDILGGGGAAPSLESTTRKVWSLFGEASVPLARSLEANVAVRHDRYSDFGGTTNPKLTVRWQPAGALVLRGSAGTGFRAPTLYDLFVPNAGGFTSPRSDPLRCPVTGSELDCDTFFRVRSGGNPDLQPETSRQFNVGFVAEPTAGLSLAVDYYGVRIDDLITVVPENAIFTDYDRWAPTHVFRRPPDAANPGLPGMIDYVLGTPVNAGSRTTTGFDLDVRLRFPAADWGRIGVSFSGTYVLEYEASEFEAAGPGTADLVTGVGAISRWRHYATIDWSRGEWGATLAQTFQLGHEEADPRTCDPFTGRCTGTRRVGSLSVWDLQARYTGVKDLAVSAGVRNLFGRDPPAAYGPTTFQRGYDASYADPRGRMFYMTLKYAFR
ncbi:MAG: TonB-dependent receptor [Lysobacter sp.]|nr:TonB-dependent receptor [Lysobacter sp.]